MKKVIMNYKVTILSVVLVLVAIMMPGSDVPSVGIPNLDKVVHCGMFGFVTMCYYWEYYRKERKVPSLVIPLIVLIAFSGLTEIIQIYVPGRSCDYRDLMADTIGILLMTLIARWKINQITKV